MQAAQRRNIDANPVLKMSIIAKASYNGFRRIVEVGKLEDDPVYEKARHWLLSNDEFAAVCAELATVTDNTVLLERVKPFLDIFSQIDAGMTELYVHCKLPFLIFRISFPTVVVRAQ